jgi:putative intracellular protease/amidase
MTVFSVFGFILLIAGTAQAEITLCYEPAWEAGNYPYFTGLGWTDVDDNGWNDFIIATGLDAGISPLIIYFNSDTGLTTSPGWVSSEVGAYCQLHMGDMDNDGDQDIIISSLGTTSPSPQYMFCDTGNTFAPTACWKSSESNISFSCAAGDPDGDGDLDISFASGNFARGFTLKTGIYFNTNGSFNSTPDWSTTNTYYGVDEAFCDIDLDGDLDFILGGRQLSIAVFKNNGGIIETTPSWVTRAIEVGRQLAFGDVDNDGYPDLAVASTEGFHLFKNNGGVLDSIPTWSCLYNNEASAVAWGDVDNDGYLELAGGGWDTHLGVFDNINGVLSDEYIWKYNGDGSFGSYYIAQVAWADYDQDGLVDTTAEFTGDGFRKLFQVRGPLHKISSLKINGTELPLNQYCYDLVAGWISLATAVPSGETFSVEYTYSKDLDLTVGTETKAWIFENVGEYYRPQAGMKILMLIGQDYGAAYNQADGPLNIADYVRRYGWDVTTTAITGTVNPCNYHLTNTGGKTLTIDTLVSEISDISNYEALIITPCASGYAAEMANPAVLNLIKSAMDSGLVVAAWCRGTRLLAAADVIDGKRVTGNADYVSEYTAAGATYMGTVPPVTDGNIVTIIRSYYYRSEGCEAIYDAILKKRYSVYRIDSSEFADDNGDGIFDPGERVQFNIFLTNDGVADTNIAISMTTNDPNIVFSNATSNIETAESHGSIDNLAIPIEFIVPMSSSPQYDSFFVEINSDKMLEKITFAFDYAVGTPEILIIDDDRGGGYEIDYHEALHQCNRPCKIWTKATEGSPSGAELKNYHIVFWYTGDSAIDFLSSSDIAAMKEYLNGGGYLMLSGQGLASEIFAEDSLFLKDYMHCRYGGKVSFSLYQDGVAGSPIGDNVKVKIITDSGQVSGLSERVIPYNGGVSNFTHSSMSIASSAVSYAGNYRTIFLAWGFEAVQDGLVDATGKDSLMMKIMGFFPDFICGDANDDHKVNLLDVSYIINALYRGGSKPEPIQRADVNSDGKMNLLDVSYIINYQYRHGPEPNCP